MKAYTNEEYKLGKKVVELEEENKQLKEKLEIFENEFLSLKRLYYDKEKADFNVILNKIAEKTFNDITNTSILDDEEIKPLINKLKGEKS